MTSRFVKLAGMAAMATAFVVATSKPAQAALMLTVFDGTTTTTVTDNGAGDTNPLTGVITTTFLGVGWSVDVNTGESKPILPNTPGDAAIDLNVSATSTKAATLQLTLSDTGFNLGGSPATEISSLGGTMRCIGCPAGSNINFLSAADGGPVLAYTATSSPYSNTQNGLFSGTTGFGMTILDTISLTGAGNVSFDHQLEATVPEPGSIALLGTGLVGLARAIRRRREKKA